MCEYVVQSIDGAYEEEEENDYQRAHHVGHLRYLPRRTTRRSSKPLLEGKKRKEVQRYHAILLEAWRGKVPFSTFKRVTIDGFKEYKPDRLLIEKKASGISLIQELRKGGLPVKADAPRPQQEVARARR